jgi:chemotaxis signal transduction protein
LKSGCGNPIDVERSVGDLRANEPGNPCRPGRSAGSGEWLREEPARATRTTTEPWFCLFHGDTGPTAVCVEAVAEVLETDTLVRLAWNPPQVVGMCSYHREVVPVVVLGPVLRDAPENFVAGQDQAVASCSAGEKAGLDERKPCVVLILKTEHGAWGLRAKSEKTIMSCELPDFHAPRINAHGAVLIGTVEHAGICYGILDAEATWRSLRSAVGRWYGLISGSDPSCPLPSGEQPNAASPGAIADIESHNGC